MIDPKKVAVEIALRTLQLQGTNQAQLESAYTTGYTALDGKQIPASALKDAVVTIEGEIHELIANDLNHPYRSALESDSDQLQSGDDMPKTDADNVEFVGMLSGIFDAEDELPLTEGTLQEIFRFGRAKGSRYNTDIRRYKIDCGKIYHTRTAAIVRGCIFDSDVALARFAGSNKSPLPASCRSLWVARTLEYMAQEGWFISEAGYYGSFAVSCVNRLKRRDTNLPTLPSKVNTATPIPS